MSAAAPGESRLSLIVAEALSSVVREVDPAAAVRRVRRVADDCPAALSAASRRCLRHDHLARSTVRQAADLLATAAMAVRQGARLP
jgi:hypothetical protein